MSAVLNLLYSLMVANINMVVNNGVGAPHMIIARAVILTLSLSPLLPTFLFSPLPPPSLPSPLPTLHRLEEEGNSNQKLLSERVAAENKIKGLEEQMTLSEDNISKVPCIDWEILTDRQI